MNMILFDCKKSVRNGRQETEMIYRPNLQLFPKRRPYPEPAGGSNLSPEIRNIVSIIILQNPCRTSSRPEIV